MLFYAQLTQNAQTDVTYAHKFRGRPKRFTLDLKKDDDSDLDEESDKIMAETIVDIGCETPRINYEQHNGRPYRYFYAISSDVDMDNPGTVCIYPKSLVFKI